MSNIPYDSFDYILCYLVDSLIYIFSSPGLLILLGLNRRLKMGGNGQTMCTNYGTLCDHIMYQHDFFANTI